MKLKAYNAGYGDKTEILFEPAEYSKISSLVINDKGKPFSGFEVDYTNWSKPISVFVDNKELEAFLELGNIELIR